MVLSLCNRIQGGSELARRLLRVLKAYRLRNDCDLSERLEQDFGPLYMDWLQNCDRYPVLGFVGDAFSEFLLNEYVLSADPTLHTVGSEFFENGRDRFMTMAEAASHLGTAPSIIERLIATGRLQNYGFPDENRDRRQLVLRSEILSLERTWYSGIRLDEAMNWLDASEEEIHMMVSTRYSSSAGATSCWDSAE